MKGIAIVLVFACVGALAQKGECPAEQETNWEIETLLRHEDCDKFYKCTFGQPIVYQCPADLYFNLETWQCDWRENVDCTDRYVPSETTTVTDAPTTTAVPSTTTTTTLAPTTTTTTPVPTTTTTTTTPAPTTTTTTPVPTTTTTTTTPAPTTTTTTTTTTPAPTTTSTTTTTTTPAPTTTTAPTTAAPGDDDQEIEFLENGCPVNPHIHWLLPHEEDCNLFYYCVWGQKVLRQCPSGLHFNTTLQVCDWTWDAGCTLSFNKHLKFRQLMRSLNIQV